MIGKTLAGMDLIPTVPLQKIQRLLCAISGHSDTQFISVAKL